ncbi:hypothetical protein PLEOSDRAFT_1049198 [Pleurotus ostreatus PC15]|uniref:Cytochrome P450 n=1 Tax=Pleurotus ostreatus (strain PC15) TaxID=1137138 RepID=A0A067NH20_PLEO1|nr:hypothetical protein PLEOSDRAFT_1049198 [Pleurotus ostreatus PC15]
MFSKYSCTIEPGDLVHIEVLGRHIVFVNSIRVANDLFEKRSANYSDRNALPMINDGTGHLDICRTADLWVTGGDRWRAHRKMFHTQFQPSSVSQFWPIQLKEAHAILRRLLDEPDALIDHLRLNAASSIMKVVYGIDVVPKDDYYVTIAERALDGMAKAASPGAFLVDILPILKYVPAWFPGASFQKKAKEWKKVTLEMRDAPFNSVAASMVAEGTASPCFVSNLLNDIDTDAVSQREIIKGCAGLAYAGGCPHAVSSLSCFVLAMVLYPEVQSKAQAELDRVVGDKRLPVFSDRDSLPYIDALVKEVLRCVCISSRPTYSRCRWNPVAPLGLPHMATNDDEYNGYFIPAGTTVIGNTWTIFHDPEMFPHPERFSPERFLRMPHPKDPGAKLDPNVDPVSPAFGYGRRICPGRFMAEGHLWIHIASILSVFNIRQAVDVFGQRIKVEALFDTGMISHPLPFKCEIVPRSKAAQALIEQTALLS